MKLAVRHVKDHPEAAVANPNNGDPPMDLKKNRVFLPEEEEGDAAAARQVAAALTRPPPPPPPGLARPPPPPPTNGPATKLVPSKPATVVHGTATPRLQVAPPTKGPTHITSWSAPSPQPSTATAAHVHT